MNTRRTFLAAGGTLAALTAANEASAAEARGMRLYLHGMVWNRGLAAPMNDWLIRLDGQVDVPLGNGPGAAAPGFATLGDDIHDTVGSHVTFQTATLKGDQLNIQGTITGSKNPALVGQAVTIEGKLVGTAVQGLTVTVGGSIFTGAGLLVVIAIIAILIAT